MELRENGREGGDIYMGVVRLRVGRRERRGHEQG